MTLRSAASISFSLYLAACGTAGDPDDPMDPGDPGDPGDPAADAAPPDPEGPTVVSVSPADGEAGVMPDADIVIQFDRPMDQASVESAWSSAVLPAAAVSFGWNPAGDVLTVTPDEPLPLAEGSGKNPDAVEPIAIAFAIAETARDAEGIALAEPVEVEFRTIRRLTLTVRYHAALSDCRYSDGSAAVGDEVLYAGDDSDNRQIKMVVSFTLPALPRGALVDEAVFVSDQRGTTPGEDVYQDLGDLRLTHVRFKSLATSFAAAALGSQSLLADDDAPGTRSVPVTQAVADDYADRLMYAQFRAEFPVATDSDNYGDIAAFERPDFVLSLAYLVE